MHPSPVPLAAGRGGEDPYPRHLVTGGVGIVSLLVYPDFLSLAGTVPNILDWGYYVSLVGCILLMPEAPY